MINSVVRRPALAATVVVLGLVGAACGGVDATGPGKGQGTSVAEPGKPPITDPAVAAAALRTVDPCAMLDKENLAEVGTLVEDSHSSSEWGVCTVESRDAGGKEFDLTLRIGDAMVSTDKATDVLEGLPLEVDKNDADSCFVTAVTSHESLLGITFQVDYPGGDPCAAGRTALTRIVRSLHGDPPRYEQVPGSVLTLDPCATADERTVAELLGKTVRGEPQSLHECDRWADDGTYPLVGVNFRQGLPEGPEDGKQVDLGGGVTAIQQERDIEDVGCTVSWRHVETPTEDEADGFGEIVSVEYTSDAAGGIDRAGACERAVKLAKTVVPKLPAA
ncbi:DUF3558 family protein [Amycolatopsis nigrescens]|uniref:DUF3558 family protein n=1 Tax=Amycolatopsis nigrescens TaxID=381445 RepID=UPI0003A2CF0C|nr:DUF3558 family protein [Amycolatopsis nigrescens]